MEQTELSQTGDTRTLGGWQSSSLPRYHPRANTVTRGRGAKVPFWLGVILILWSNISVTSASGTAHDADLIVIQPNGGTDSLLSLEFDPNMSFATLKTQFQGSRALPYQGFSDTDLLTPKDLTAVFTTLDGSKDTLTDDLTAMTETYPSSLHLRESPEQMLDERHLGTWSLELLEG